MGLAKPPVKEPEKRSTLWWKEIGLLGDPFPTYTGLDQIPPDKYDDVVVLTPFFRRYIQEANKHPGMLIGKTILIGGEFGSGKTTLLQYLSAAMGRHGVMPVRVNFITYRPGGKPDKGNGRTNLRFALLAVHLQARSGPARAVHTYRSMWFRLTRASSGTG